MPFDGLYLGVSKKMPENDLIDQEGRQIYAVPTHLFNALLRMSERVTTLEADQKALKNDTEVIRLNIHGINNEMQKFGALETGCAASLKAIEAHNLSQAANIAEMSTTLKNLTKLRDETQGAWWAIVRVCTVVVAAFTIMASIAAGVAWLLEHHVSFSLI